MSPGSLSVTPYCFQDFGSFSLSLFRNLYRVDSLSLPVWFGLVWWAFILFLYLLGVSLPFRLVYIAVFGVAFPYSGSCGSSLLWRFLTVGGAGWVACQDFLVREAFVSLLVGGAGFLLSVVQ